MPENKPALNPFGYNPPEESPKNGKIRVKLITPLFEATIIEADKVLLPALDGDILILPERAPIFFSIRPGRMNKETGRKIQPSKVSRRVMVTESFILLQHFLQLIQLVHSFNGGECLHTDGA